MGEVIKMKFSKSLARYYCKWFSDCHESAIYCSQKGDDKKAAEYLRDAEKYLTIIMEHWDEIEAFSKEP